MHIRRLIPVLYETPAIALTALKLWVNHNPLGNAAALAFYTLFSVAPIMILAVAALGLIIGPDVAETRLVAQVEMAIGAEAAQMLSQIIADARIQEAGWLPTLAGIGAMVVGATALFAQLQRALNALWEVPLPRGKRRVVRLLINRLLSLLLVGAFGLLLLASVISTVAIRALAQFAGEWLPFDLSLAAKLEPVASVALVAVFLAAIFRFLPNVAPAWRHVLPAALVTALLFMPGRALMATYITLMAPASAYGAAGSLVVLLLWVYGSALIILLGAALTRALHEHETGDHHRGRRVPAP